MADLPLGDVVVGLVGALVIIAGGILLRRGWRAEFERTIDMQTFSPRAVAATRAVVRVGIMARGLVVFLIGVFLVLAAWKHDPSEAIGMEGALRVLSSHPLGPWAVAAVALGLATYGFYEVLLAWRGRFYID